jgi:hypothetical protein
MPLDELLRLVPPLANPVEAGDECRWQAVQASLGLSLPEEYRDVSMRYGSGSFSAGELTITLCNPFAGNYLRVIDAECQALRQARGLVGRQQVPYGVFPDRPGWLPFGHDGEYGPLCWVTEGQPERWPILHISRERTGFYQAQLPLTTFLTRSLTGELRTGFWDPESEGCREDVCFVPAPPVPLDSAQPAAPPGTPSTAGRAAAPAGPVAAPAVEWLEPDAFGRPLGVRVVLAPQSLRHLMAPFTCYPAWWPTALPAPPSQWRRRHLLSWRFGGPGGAAWYNLLPMTDRAHQLLLGLERGLVTFLTLGQSLTWEVRAVYDAHDSARRAPTEVLVTAAPVPGTGSTFGLPPTAIPNR